MKLSSLFFALLFASSYALASDEGTYVGVNAIYGKVDMQDISENGQSYTPKTNETFGGGLNFGYNISKNMALDAALDGFNKIDFNGENAPSQQYWFSYLAVKPMLDLWKFNAFISFGAAYVSMNQNDFEDANDISHAMIRPYFGGGLGFNFSPNTELDISINRIQDINTPITFGMLSLTYHFVNRYDDSGFLAD